MDKEGNAQGRVWANKFVLSLVSPVFRTSFGSDNADQKSEVIRTKETTKAAFQALIDFIYRQEVEFEQMTAQELFDLLDLAEYYNITELNTILNKQLANLPIAEDMEKVLQVARIAENFALFEEASKAVFANCAKVLNQVLGTPYRESFIAFNIKLIELGEEELGVKLVAMMPCSNCQQSPCQSGAVISSGHLLRVGTIVTQTNKLDFAFLDLGGYPGPRGNAVVEAVHVGGGVPTPAVAGTVGAEENPVAFLWNHEMVQKIRQQIRHVIKNIAS